MNNRTNKKWYPYFQQLAGYCKLENGQLLYQHAFSTFEEVGRIYKLDWDAIDNEEDLRLFKSIEEELKTKE